MTITTINFSYIKSLNIQTYTTYTIVSAVPPSKVPDLVISPLSSIDLNKWQDNQKVKGPKPKRQKRAIFGLIMDWGRIIYRAGAKAVRNATLRS